MDVTTKCAVWLLWCVFLSQQWRAGWKSSLLRLCWVQEYQHFLHWICGYQDFPFFFFFLLVKDQVIHILSSHSMQHVFGLPEGYGRCSEAVIPANVFITNYFCIYLLEIVTKQMNCRQSLGSGIKKGDLRTSYLFTHAQWAICGPQQLLYVDDRHFKFAIWVYRLSSVACDWSDWGGWVGMGALLELEKSPSCAFLTWVKFSCSLTSSTVVQSLCKLPGLTLCCITLGELWGMTNKGAFELTWCPRTFGSWEQI